MDYSNDILLPEQKAIRNSDVEEQTILDPGQFILISVATFGLYEVWWMYKVWRFYKQRDKLDIMPAPRAIFAFFFLHSLLSEILIFAKRKGYTTEYSPGLLFAGFIILNLLSRLPDPFWLISVSSVLCLIEPFKAFNFALLNSPEFVVNRQGFFSPKQIVLIALGSIMWVAVFAGLAMEK
jgi:hypothetical protein